MNPELADDDEWQHDGLSFLQQRDCFCDAFTQIDVSIGVESDPHRLFAVPRLQHGRMRREMLRDQLAQVQGVALAHPEP